MTANINDNINNSSNSNNEVNHNQPSLPADDMEFASSLSALKPAAMPDNLFRSILNETIHNKEDAAPQINNSISINTTPVPLRQQYARAAFIGIACGLIGLLVGRLSASKPAQQADNLVTNTSTNNPAANFDKNMITPIDDDNTEYLVKDNHNSQKPYSRAAYFNAAQTDSLDEQLDRSTRALRSSLHPNDNNYNNNNLNINSSLVTRDNIWNNSASDITH